MNAMTRPSPKALRSRKGYTFYFCVLLWGLVCDCLLVTNLCTTADTRGHAHAHMKKSWTFPTLAAYDRCMLSTHMYQMKVS